MAMADITVLGAGIFGLSTAWTCVQRGARVQVIDPQGVGAGSSGGDVGAWSLRSSARALQPICGAARRHGVWSLRACPNGSRKAPAAPWYMTP